MRVRTLHALVSLSLLAAAALAAAGELRLGTCAQCNTPIAETNRRFAVVVPKGLEYSAYDDIGCAVLTRNAECATRQGMFDSNAVVYDHPSGAEVPAEQAYFAYRSDVRTPKGYGIVAFKDKAAAEAFASEHGKGRVIKWYLLVDEKMAP